MENISPCFETLSILEKTPDAILRDVDTFLSDRLFNFTIVSVPYVTVQNYAPEYAAFMSIQLLLPELCVDGTEASIDFCCRSTHTILMLFTRYFPETVITAADQFTCFWFSIIMAD